VEDFKDMACVILAGGRGERMASAERHKVCFPIAGRPAIIRAVDTYKAAGLRRFLVVVGQLAEQVIATLTAAHPEVSYIFQNEPRGTGHAAAVAAEALAAQDFHGPVVLVMGDKVTRPPVVRRLLEEYRRSQPDVLVTTLPKRAESSAGRVVTDDRGRVLGIVEVADIRQARSSGGRLSLGPRRLSPGQVEEASDSVNASMYVFRFDALRDALSRLRSNNAQGEIYLTDTVELIASTGSVQAMHVADPTDLMAFNTPAELMAVEGVLRQRTKPPRVSVATERAARRPSLKPAGLWLDLLRNPRPGLLKYLKRTYGQDESVLQQRRSAMLRVAGAFAKAYGPTRKMVLSRAPGRINLMGRHVDHRGGFVNVMAIENEVLLAAGPRQDDAVRLRNLDGRSFPGREFQISDLLRQASWSDWIDFVNSHTVREVLESARGDWSHYARAPLLRLQHECREVPLRGMDCMLDGDIPVGAGLSSSSAMVVAFATAAVALNGLDVQTSDFVDLCGEGEWFVGSRGGSADHAAIRTAQLGRVSRIGFFPFCLTGEVPFPADLRLVIAHSGSIAVKSSGARDTFNQRVACYELAELFLRINWPPAAGIEHLRDLTPARLGLQASDVYRAMMRLPISPTRRRLLRLFGPRDRDRLEAIFSTHADPGRYDLRGVALYGISEVLRSECFADAVAAGDLRRIGRLMRTSHDGDRVVRFDESGRSRPHGVRLTDAVLDRLAARNADLLDQTGQYSCSTEAIDNLVDIATATEGVVGAQLAGAGLGGCMMILARDSALEPLRRRLRKCFYAPRSLAYDAHVVTPVDGAGLVEA
jgi:N-acetylgalactosamine kinase